MILVPLLNPKFATALAAKCVRTSGSRHYVPQLIVNFNHSNAAAIDRNQVAEAPSTGL